MKKRSVGIVVGRFQVPTLTTGHTHLLSTMRMGGHDAMAVFLGSPMYPNRNNCLDFSYRARGIRGALGNEYHLTVFNIIDERDDKVWSDKFDRIVEEQYAGHDVYLYGGRDCFIKRYHGKYKDSFKEVGIASPSGSEIRGYVSMGYDKSFAEGMVYAYNNQYPNVRPTVDIAVMDGQSFKILTIEKNSDYGMQRLPGGHVDLKDLSMAHAASRELKEETGVTIAPEDLKYVGSYKVNDWRFKDDNAEGIMTTLFSAVINRADHTLAAGDDANFVGWMTLKDLDQVVVPEHKILLRPFLSVPI